MRSTAARLALLTASSAGLLMAGCGSAPAAKAPAPSTAELLAHESELLKLTLSEQAVRQLGIKTYAVRSGSVASRLSVHGEVVAPAFGGAAGLGSRSDLAALASNQLRADADIARARVDVAAAREAAERAQALIEEEAGSVRAGQEANSALAVAQAGLRAAQAQRALLGPAANAIGQGALWVRVPVSASDLPAVARNAPAAIATLGSASVGLQARPVQGPPSADAATGTVDLYFALPASRAGFRVGQRVSVELPVAGRDEGGMLVPRQALLNDIYGGEWVYLAAGPRQYHRQRVEVAAVENGMALIARGLAPGDQVVTDGAAELFGTEFGAK